jgi:hypothetical protein
MHLSYFISPTAYIRPSLCSSYIALLRVICNQRPALATLNMIRCQRQQAYSIHKWWAEACIFFFDCSRLSNPTTYPDQTLGTYCQSFLEKIVSFYFNKGRSYTQWDSIHSYLGLNCHWIFMYSVILTWLCSEKRNQEPVLQCWISLHYISPESLHQWYNYLNIPRYLLTITFLGSIVDGQQMRIVFKFILYKKHFFIQLRLLFCSV